MHHAPRAGCAAGTLRRSLPNGCLQMLRLRSAAVRQRWPAGASCSRGWCARRGAATAGGGAAAAAALPALGQVRARLNNHVLSVNPFARESRPIVREKVPNQPAPCQVIAVHLSEGQSAAAAAGGKLQP
jgi:hypothetical protein